MQNMNKMHINKYVPAHIIILHQHVSVTSYKTPCWWSRQWPKRAGVE